MSPETETFKLRLIKQAECRGMFYSNKNIFLTNA